MNSNDNRPDPSAPLADPTSSAPTDVPRRSATQTGQALRKQANEILREKPALSREDMKSMSPEETLRMLHDLQVHQIELELQNEELRRAQTELTTMRERYFSLYDLAPVGYVTISNQGMILEANFTAASLLGVTRGTLAGQSISRFISKEYQDTYYLFHKQLLETGEPQLCELLMAADGARTFWAQLRSTTTHDFDGTLQYHFVLSDITEQKHAAEALQGSEERFRKLFESHSAIKLILDAKTGAIIDANKAAAQFYGWPVEELKRMRIEQINTLPPEAVKAAMEQAALSEHTSFEFHHRRADGSLREVEVFSNKIEMGGKGFFFSIIHDITERKRNEEALRKSEARFRRVLQDVQSVAIQGYRPDGTIHYWNHASEKLYGYSEQEALGDNIVDLLITPETRNDFAQKIHQMIEKGQPIPAAELSVLRKDGSRVAVFSSHSIIQMPGDQQELFCFDIDLSERKQTELALRRSEACLHVANEELEQQNRELTKLWGKSRQTETDLNRANQALHRQTVALAATNKKVENEKRLLAAVMEALPTGVAITDTQGGTLQLNSAYERIWGGPRPETRSVEDYAAYKAWWEGTGKPVAPEEWASAVAVQKGEVTVGQMMRIQRFDGSEVFVINSASPVYDIEGTVVGSAVAIQDITELKRSEHALLESRKDFARAQEVGNIGSWRLDIRRNVLTWSDENHRLFGVPIGTALQYETFLDIVHPDDRASVDGQWKATLRGEPYDLEHRIVVDGRIKWVREKAYLEHDQDGLLTGGFGITQDITERKQTEEALRKSEERHRVLAESMLQGVVHQDAAGTIIEMNPAAAHILGKNREQFLGSSSTQEEHDTIRENGEYFPGLEHPALVALRTGLPERDVIMGVFNPKLGAYRWICIDAVPVFPQGELHPSEVYTVFEDITERKQAEEAIRRHNAILEGINGVLATALTCQTEEELGVACLDIAQKITQSKFGFISDINEKGLQDIAISNPGWEACSLITPQGHRRPPCSFKIHGIYGRVITDGRALFTNDPANFPDRVGVPLGHPPLEAFLGAPLIREGRTIGLIAVANRPGGYTPVEQEILTALTPAMVEAFMRKRAEEALRLSEERFRMLFTTLIEGFCIIEVLFDADHRPVDYRFLEINPAFEAQTGLRNVQGRLISELVPENEPLWCAMYGKVAMTGEPVRFINEVKALHRWYDVSAYKLTGQGSHNKVAILFNDITQRKQAEEQLVTMNDELERMVERRTLELQETQKQYLHSEKLSAIGKLSASIAHEFNNPLQGILSVLKGLKRRATLQEEDRNLLDEAIEEGDRVKELIRSLQEFNRPTSSRKSMLDVHKSLDAVLLLHTSDFKSKRIAVERKYAELLPQIQVVADQIKQVFLNLLNNAADACQQPGGVITVSTWQEGDDRVAISIKDTGIGIKPSEVDLIFQPFYTTKPAVKGTGLGLSICFGIVKQHQGEIRVESRAGRGTTFTILLPIKGSEAVS